MDITEGPILLADADDCVDPHDPLVAIYQMESAIVAQKLGVLADRYRTEQCHGEKDFEWFVDTVAAETGTSIGKISNDLTLALQLTDTLPKTFSLLAQGELDVHKARRIADAARTLTPELCAELEELIYPDVLDKTVRALARHVNRVAAELDPAAAEQRRQKSRADRHVWFEPEPATGMGWLSAYLPGEDLMAISKRLDTLATSNNDGVRTIDQRRADTLRDLLLGTTATITTTTCADAPRTGDQLGPPAADGLRMAGNSCPTDTATGRGGCVGDPAATARRTDCPGGVAATIYVTVSAETLLGLDQRAGELRGFGPITAEYARELAFNVRAEWLGVLVDHNGRAVTMTRKAYPFQGRLAEFIRLRDTTCTHPGCDRSADRCDIDHVIPWPRGQTTPDNASTECRRHHRMKTLTDWEVRRKDDHIEWRKPNGTTLTKPVEPIAATSPQPKAAKPLNDDPPPF